MKKLSSISTKMVELETRIEELKKIKEPGEDLEVCEEELRGLEDLVLENAQDLHSASSRSQDLQTSTKTPSANSPAATFGLSSQSPRNTATVA